MNSGDRQIRQSGRGGLYSYCIALCVTTSFSRPQRRWFRHQIGQRITVEHREESGCGFVQNALQAASWQYPARAFPSVLAFDHCVTFLAEANDVADADLVGGATRR